MAYDPDRHHRRSIRLQGYDYTQAGAYYITICTEGRICLFGDVNQDTVIPTLAGEVVQNTWDALPRRFASVVLDALVVMPNHVHGIIAIMPPDDPRRGAACCALLGGVAQEGAACSAPTLGGIVRAFKSISAIAVNRALGRPGQPLWQRNYYERIIRNERELDAIREYITNNPAQWSADRENPAAWPHP